MKATIVPAQITTIEDRIIGNLGISQILLLTVPILGSTLLYITLPPTLHATTYKLVLIAALSSVCMVMAARFKGVILLRWFVTIQKYYVRPRYYVFNKHSMHGRELYEKSVAVQQKRDQPFKQPTKTKLKLTTTEVVQVYDMLDNPSANVTFEIRKGGYLYVRATEVKQES